MASERNPVNRAEEFVLRICRNSCLSLWCYNNPRGRGGKELCDILVVCQPHIIIVSVKEVILGSSGTLEVEHERWQRRAVEASVKQIEGAQRWLESASHVVRSDGSRGLDLPPLMDREVHRIAVALGGKGEVCLTARDMGKGFVHVMDEQSFLEVLTELDTITELVEYLEAKEALVTGGCSAIFEGPESNMLGWYLYNGRSFPQGPTMMVMDGNIWQGMKKKPEFIRRKQADRESYIWDELIESYSDPEAKPVLGSGETLTQLELGLRVMARETRFSRRILGRGFRQFLELAKARKVRSRTMRGPSGIIYVLVSFSAGLDQKLRYGEMVMRCYAARHRIGSGEIVVGIGIGKFLPGVGTAMELAYLSLPNWSPQDDEKAISMMAQLGVNDGRPFEHLDEDEFPLSDSRTGIR